MPGGFPTAPVMMTITDKLATIAPSVGNVAGYYVWLVDMVARITYGPSALTDGSGNWSINALPGTYEARYSASVVNGYVQPPVWVSGKPTSVAGAFSPYIASNPPPDMQLGVGGAVYDKGGDRYNARAFAIKSDGQFISDGVMNGTTAVLTSAGNKFAPGDVGKLCLVPGAGAAGALLTTTIASYQNSGQVTLAAVSQTAVATAWVTWGTDDTAGWTALDAAVPDGAIVSFLGFSLITAVLPVTKSRTLESAFTLLYGTAAQSLATQSPGVFPFISGSAIVQCTAATHGIAVTATSLQLNLRNVAIKFADGIAFINTGHGIYASPAATYLTGHENGMVECRWDKVAVWGHDGNHYAYYLVNCNLSTFLHPRGYGGGGLYLECESAFAPYGNQVWVHPYFDVFCGGTAHGYMMVSQTHGQNLNLISFFRPQANIVDAPPALWWMMVAHGGTLVTTPTAAQKLWQSVSNPVAIDIYNADLETSIGGTANFGTPTYTNPDTGMVNPVFQGVLKALFGFQIAAADATTGAWIRVDGAGNGNLILSTKGTGFFLGFGSTCTINIGSGNPGSLTVDTAAPSSSAVLGSTGLLTLAHGVSVTAGGIKASLAAFAASDKYVVAAADGTFHVSALGPAS